MICDPQTLEFKRRILPPINDLLMVHIPNPSTNIFGSCSGIFIRIFVVFCKETKTVQQRRGHRLHYGMISGPTEVEQTKTRNVDLISGGSDNTVDGGFQEAC